MDDSLQDRMNQILGSPPRVEPIAPEELDERVLEPINRMREYRDYPLDAAVTHPFYLTMGRSPEMFRSFMSLGVSVNVESTIPIRLRELAILRCGWLCGAPYEWGEHVIGAKQAGLGSDEIERVTRGSQAQEWDEVDRTLLKAVEELHTDAMISDATWSALSNDFDERQLVELPVIIGHYHMTAFIQNSLRTPLNSTNPGLTAR